MSKRNSKTKNYLLSHVLSGKNIKRIKQSMQNNTDKKTKKANKSRKTHRQRQAELKGFY